MAILVELRASVALSWSDYTGDVLWFGYGDVYFRNVDDPETKYLSMDGQAFDHYWDAHIISFTAPTYQTAKIYGGFAKMDFGTITLSPDVFLSEWPPPRYCIIDAYHTATTEGAAKRIFNGNIYLDKYSEKSVTYNLYSPTYSEDLLEMTADLADTHGSTTDYSLNDVVLPRAFGMVDHVEPVRLPDFGESFAPTYHLGGLATTSDAKTIASFTSASSGTKTLVTCTTAHGWSNGASVTIDGTINFSATHIIESVTATTFVIPVEFPTDNGEHLPIFANAYTEGSFAVYDGGWPVLFILNDDGTFSLTETPTGEKVTMSGTGADTTLTEIMDWATTQFGISTYDGNTIRARTISPDVSYWATSQKPLIDFLSDLCAFFTHYFYIKADQLYLCDMFKNNGTDSLDEYEYFVASYSVADAVKQLTATWNTHAYTEERLPDATTGKVYIKDIKQEVVVTADYPWGEEQAITPYHDTVENVTTALDNIMLILNKDTATIDIPITSALPDPGKKLTFSDNIMPTTMSTYIWARSLQYDFANDKIKISGEGVIA